MTDPRADHYAPVMPYMAVPDARAALKFYARAFGAETVHEVPDDETGGLMHARMIVNGTMVMPPWGERFSRVIDPFGHHWAIGGRQ